MPRSLIIFQKFLFAFFLITISFFVDCLAAENAVKKSVNKAPKEAPTKIRSDIIDIKRKSQSVNFIGNVIIEKEDSSFLSQKMTILYDEKKSKKSPKKVQQDGAQEADAEQEGETKMEENKQSSIRKIYTDQKVKIFSDEFIATGDSGYYDPKEDVFVLEQNVMVNNGVSIAKGDKFIYNISTKKSNFVGQKKDDNDYADKRVVVIIGDDSKDLKKSDFKKSKDKK